MSAISDGASGAPLFSVVVPTYARPQQLRACLEALARLDYPQERFEVIVVDDGSPMPLELAVAPFRDRLDLRLVRQANAGPAAARNTGAAHARGVFLAFTDDDCAPLPSWLRAFANRFAAAPDHLLGGRTINVLTNNPFATASQQLISYVCDYYNDDVPGRRKFFPSNNMAVPAQAFREAGGFDASLSIASEDRELCSRWSHSLGPMSFVADAVVEHAHDLSFSQFCRQHYNYGRGAYDFQGALHRSGRRSVDIEPPAFYIDMLRHPLREGRGPRSVAVVALLVVAQLASAIGFYAESFRRDRRVSAKASHADRS